MSEHSTQRSLSAAQRGTWLAQQLDPANPRHNIAQYFEFTAGLDPVTLERAWRHTVGKPGR